ncbi:gliding motility lipoprotein GldH [Inquilinus sp. KBS0705]|nr:gliding motility lipoprotein GldH [Inquilinus sp. KBS0705]
MQRLKIVLGVFIALVLFTAQGCTDPLSVYDQNQEVVNHNWSYVNRIKFDVKIEDETIPYNIYFNLRVAGTYKYSNIFALFFRSNPGAKTQVTRFEFKLANADGEWLGSGSGNLYSYQLPLLTQYKFPKKGTYHFELEQNMRDNPLRDVTDVGLRVEKVK